MDLSFVLVLAIVAYLLALKLIPKVRKATWEFAQAYLRQEIVSTWLPPITGVIQAANFGGLDSDRNPAAFHRRNHTRQAG